MSHSEPETYLILFARSLVAFAYSIDCTFFRFLCLTAKALRRITMRSFLVGATKPKKRTLKRVQLGFSG